MKIFSLKMLHISHAKNDKICFYSAAQMWLLGRILPIVIGDLVPEGDPHWENYLLMMRIADILFSPRIHEDHMGYLSQLIFAHHTRFRELYPSASVLPKMHFMVHMPRLTLQYVQTELIIVFNRSEPSLIQTLVM